MVQRPHDRPDDLVVEHLLFGHEPHQPSRPYLAGRKAGEGEVEVSGVVDRHHRASGGGQVLQTGDGELQALDAPKQSDARNDGPVCRFHKTTLPAGG